MSPGFEIGALATRAPFDTAKTASSDRIATLAEVEAINDPENTLDDGLDCSRFCTRWPVGN
jgi:hypothetical protein